MSSRRRSSSSLVPVSRPAMLLPNSNAHRPMAAQNPRTTAAATHRSGQGMALRTAIRGALIVRRRRSSRKRIAQQYSQKKAAARKLVRLVVEARKTSTLGELLATACGVQADLLAFDFARIARHEAGLRQRRLERRVVVDQRAGDAVARGAGLPGLTAAV